MKAGHYISINVAAAVSVLLCIVVSCSKVSYADPVVETDAHLAFRMDWSGVSLQDNQPPHEVTVIMTRIKSVVRHYLWSVDSEGNVIMPEPENTLDEMPSGNNDIEMGPDIIPEQGNDGPGSWDVIEDELQPEPEPDKETIAKGNYIVAGICWYDPKDYIICEKEDFLASEDMMVKDVRVKIPELSEEEVAALNILDLNPTAPYIRSVGPCYYVKEENGGVRTVPSEGGIRLTFRQLTCRLAFSVDIAKEEGVVIEKVVGVMSGLPMEAYMMSGNVDDTKTGKMSFTMEEVGLQYATGASRYTGSINTFGVVASADKNVRTGDGILNIIIEASLQEGQEEYMRVFTVSFNIKEMIEKSKLMLRVGEKQEYCRLAYTECSFDTKKTLNVRKEDIMSDSQGGFVEWVEDESTDEGLNQEI